MDPRRVAACGTITLSGAAILAIAVAHTLGGPGGLAGIVLALVGGLLGLGFVAGSGLLYRSDVRTRHALRIAGWNGLGIAATVVVLAIVAGYQDAIGGSVRSPIFSGSIVVGVSAMAHVLIGLNDVRRIRAETVARQREQASVINRVVRHDMRTAAQVLLGAGETLRTRVEDETAVTQAERIVAIAERLAAMDEQVETVTDLVDADRVEATPVALDEYVEEAVAAVRDTHPEAEVVVEGTEDVRVAAGDALRVALRELVENGVEYGGGPARVTVRFEAGADAVIVDVTDDGPGVPAQEQELIEGEREVTQLSHSEGLGLWLTKWIVEAYDGRVAFPDGEQSTVRIELPRA